MSKRIFSGIQPSGSLHLGNYLGAIRNWVKRQDDGENFFCVVDLHAITVPQDPIVLKSNSRELAALYFACGIDPEKSTVFIQSHVQEHTELAWILNCFLPMGWMQRMTQYKDKSAKQKKTTVGLFDYPALMAADILLYDTNEVPVGEDQKQHVELTRDLAELINSRCGDDTFVVPEPVIPPVGARIMGLDDPMSKMAKSDGKPNRVIFLLDEPEVIKKKIARAVTDSQTEIVFDKDRAGVYNLLTIYELLSGQTRDAIEAHFAGKQYSDLKRDISECVIEHLRPIRETANKLLKDEQAIDELLKTGAEKSRRIAQQTMTRVRSRIGIGE